MIEKVTPAMLIIGPASMMTTERAASGVPAYDQPAAIPARTRRASTSSAAVASATAPAPNHVGTNRNVARNAARALLLGLSGGRLVPPPLPGAARRCFGRLTRGSAACALVSDAAMGTLGGTLKRREKITGRLADALAWMYLASAALEKFADDGQPEHDVPFVRWACAHAEHQIERALQGVLDHLPARAAAWALRPLVFPVGVSGRGPDEARAEAIEVDSFPPEHFATLRH